MMVTTKLPLDGQFKHVIEFSFEEIASHFSKFNIEGSAIRANAVFMRLVEMYAKTTNRWSEKIWLTEEQKNSIRKQVHEYYAQHTPTPSETKAKVLESLSKEPTAENIWDTIHSVGIHIVSTINNRCSRH